VLLHRDRLANSLLRGVRYRRRSAVLVALIFAIAWAVLFSASLPADSASAASSGSMNSVPVMLFVFLIVMMIAGIATWLGGRPFDEEIYKAQEAFETSVVLQSHRLQKEREKVFNSITAADTARHEFLNTMSIELRQPLNTIIGFSSLLYQNIDEHRVQMRRRAYAFDINRSAMHLLNIVNDILDVSNLSTGTSDMRIERISAIELLETCHKLQEIRGTKTGLAFVYDLPDEDIHFNADPGRLQQILLNLFSNAVKFTDPPGCIHIRLRETSNREIQFRIKDEGIGIPVDDMDTVLQQFGKVDSQEYALRNEEGLGLGLTLVQQLTKMHQGSFKFESTEDVGTVVTITLPIELMINTDIETRNPSSA